MEWLKTIGIALLAVFAPIQAVILTVGVLIFADLITGVLAARKRGEPITSAALRRTLTKLCVYQIVIMVGFLVETHLVSGLIPIVKIASGLIGVVETKSMVENAQEITGLDFTKLAKLLGSKNDE